MFQKADHTISRRQFLSLGGLFSLGAASACASPSGVASVSKSTKKRSLRIAHLTDMHILPVGSIENKVASAFRHAQAQADPPDIILNTGDSIMDSLKTTKDEAQKQWDAFDQVVQAECKLPIYHAIGNHDVWGWGLPQAGAEIQSDPLYGKNLAMQRLGLENRYYSFDRSGWHFIVLDSTHLPNDASQHPYIGMLDDEQYQWLVKDVEQAGSETPICIVSHIPILCACEFFDGDNESSGNWVVPAAWMHIDARRFRSLFLSHPNIRLCLSGHAHQYESLDYLGVRYLTDGAVCGNWWGGAYLDFPPAYVLVDLYEDGSADSQFVAYAA
jgi:3',5'-cyclic-AMP phosphodiesterase